MFLDTVNNKLKLVKVLQRMREQKCVMQLCKLDRPTSIYIGRFGKTKEGWLCYSVNDSYISKQLKKKKNKNGVRLSRKTLVKC